MGRLSIIAVLTLLLLAASCGGGESNAPELPPKPEPPASTVQRACDWLWQQQDSDGGWHSSTYGLMRSGQSLTPFVLHALLNVPETKAKRPKLGVQRALSFIRKHTNAMGCLGHSDPDIADYPNHATSYALRCLVAAGEKSDQKLIVRMGGYLLAQQFNTERGFNEEKLRWGGWGFGSQGHAGVMDVGHTRHALEALRDAKSLDTGTVRRAQTYLRLIQRHPDEWRTQPNVPGQPEGEAHDTYDGGFYFSPVDLGMNKGRHEPTIDGRAAYFRSYATATCDGLLSLLACGVSVTDERVKAAAAWLDKYPGLDRPAGVPTDNPTPWYDAIRFYHLAVRAEAWGAIKREGDWRSDIERILEKAQRPNGSFLNEASPMMKENDPILCTALAVVALGHTE